jgi:coenzyme F420-0:L-glutamate ligase/coenzyme F420-1:gamma-L-glutamate ligase
MAMKPSLTVYAVSGLPEVRPGDDLAGLILEATSLQDGDVLVVTQKVVSKAEGRLLRVDGDSDAIRRAAISESRRVLRERNGMLITETRHGFVCANAGVDVSNVEEGWLALLPLDPDRSARRIRDAIRHRRGIEVAVVISDTFGRTWRRGLVDVAIGVAGIGAILDLRGQPDALGRPLRVTEVCVADELAAAAELAMGKSRGVPVAVIRGVDRNWFRDSSVKAEVIRRYEEDLFR